MRIVHWLVDEGSGAFVARCEGPITAQEADVLAQRWWMGSNRTQILAVTTADGTPLLVYERTEVDASRIPDEWAFRHKKDQFKTRLSQEAHLDVVRPVAAPSPSRPRVPEGACAACHQCSAPAQMDTHLAPIQQTPSGRLANNRCPLCGMVLPTGTALSVQARYLRVLAQR